MLALAGLAFLAGVALGAGSGSGGGSGALPAGATAAERLAAKSRADVDRLPLSRQVGKLVVLRFNGTSEPRYVRDVLRSGRAAGAILFHDNLTGPAQAKRLVAALRRGAPVTPIVCVDQEGGSIRILPWAPPQRTQAQQLAAGDVAAEARHAGQALHDTGINVSLAPVADVASVRGAALAGRAFSRDFGSTAIAIAQSVKGWEAGGVAPTVKHFPGLGGATTNTDFGPATITRTAAQLHEQDLLPFVAAIRAGVPLVMAGHARYPALDRSRIASQSHRIVTGLLRGELGFTGVVMTDSTEAAAVQAVSSVEVAAVRNLRAGVDIVLTTGRGSYIRAYRALLAQARRDPAFRARVRESAARVMALQATLK